ncbi:unnamed protein product [Tilletia controversa]|nr:unnamed protein product [Tilletia caries]CAD6929392.1 unnamed protein product [Tilletia controversa]CAD7063230.1 unnamed protein product [Tilletia caries]
MPPQHAPAWQASGGPWGQASSTPWRSRPPQESSAAPNAVSTTATTTDESGVTPLQVFRAMPREDKETFRRILGSMGTTTRDFLRTVPLAQLPEDAIQRIAVPLGSTTPLNPLPDASDLGIDEADPAAEDTAASAPVTVAPASSSTPALNSSPDRSEEEPLPPSGPPPTSAAPAAPAPVVITPPPTRPLICRPEVLGECTIRIVGDSSASGWHP